MTFRTGLAAFLAALAAPAWAARDITQDDIFGLVPEPMVTAASRRPQSLREAPSAVTVITAEDIRASGATSIPQLLRSVAGLNVSQATASEWSVSARDKNQFPSEGMLTLVDGRVVYLDFFSLVLWDALPVGLSEIERIEVVRSPNSALWGANAMSGVIHIVTKSPENAAGAAVEYRAGNEGQQVAEAVLGGTSGRWGWRAGGGYDARDNFSNPLSGRTQDGPGDRSARGNALLRRDWGGAGKTTLRAGADRSAGDVLTLVGLVEREGTTSFAQADHEWGSSRLQAYYNGLNIHAESPGFPAGPIRTDAFDGEFQNTFHVAGQALTWGATGRSNRYDSQVVGGEASDTRWGVFLQDEYSPATPVKLTLGGRYDSFSGSRRFVSGRFGAVWTPQRDHTLRFSAGRSFNNPDAVDSHARLPLQRNLRQLNPAFPSAPFTMTLLGDKGLAPERVDSAELGYFTSVLPRTGFRLDVFLKKLKDDVLPVVADTYAANALFPGSPGGVVPRTLREVNVGDGNVWGGEAGADVAAASWLTCFVNYSLQRESGFLPGLGGPKNKANAGLNARLGRRARAALTGHYYDARRFEPRTQLTRPSGPSKLPSYVTTDARLAFAATPSLELSVAGVNVFNKRHREYVDTDLLERRWLAGARWSF
jgi:iron complex outermembrane recepter protein